MEKINTLYSLYQLEVVSGDIYTSAQLKFVKRSGGITELDKIIRLGTIAELRKTSSINSIPSWHKLSIPGSIPFEILFKTRNLNHFGKGKFNRREEECLLVLKEHKLYIFVFKNSKAQLNSLSSPLGTNGENQQDYRSISKNDRVEAKFYLNEQSILDDMDLLIKSLSPLAKSKCL